MGNIIKSRCWNGFLFVIDDLSDDRLCGDVSTHVRCDIDVISPSAGCILINILRIALNWCFFIYNFVYLLYDDGIATYNMEQWFSLKIKIFFLNYGDKRLQCTLNFCILWRWLATFIIEINSALTPATLSNSQNEIPHRQFSISPISMFSFFHTKSLRSWPHPLMSTYLKYSWVLQFF